MSMTQEDRQIEDLKVEDLMIPSEKVAHVQLNNPLEHALLILVKSGYSAVPVLDESYKLVGLISKTIIMDQILGLERYEVEKLSEMKIFEIMDENVIRIERNATFIDGVKSVIDAPFSCVIDTDGFFDGILTRRTILKYFKRDYYTSDRNK